MEHSNPSCEMSLCLISLPLAPALRHGEKFMTLQDWRDFESNQVLLVEDWSFFVEARLLIRPQPRKAAKSDEYLRPLSGGQED